MQKRRPGRQHKLSAFSLFHIEFNGVRPLFPHYIGRKVWHDIEAAPFLSSMDNELFSLRVAVKVPIIGIGAAARCFLPAVAERLHTTVRFPEHYEVGNAVGAALISRENDGGRLF